jgi:hypothetical protein
MTNSYACLAGWMREHLLLEALHKQQLLLLFIYLSILQYWGLNSGPDTC